MYAVSQNRIECTKGKQNKTNKKTNYKRFARFINKRTQCFVALIYFGGEKGRTRRAREEVGQSGCLGARGRKQVRTETVRRAYKTVAPKVRIKKKDTKDP